MRASTLNIFDSLDTPLLDYIASYEEPAAAPPPPASAQRERPALDSRHLLEIFGWFFNPRPSGQ